MRPDPERRPFPLPGMSAAGFWRAALRQGGRNGLRRTGDAAEEAFWRDHAPGYDARSPLAACARELIDDLLAMIGAGWRMVEIGAGPGAFTRRLAPKLSAITVVEPSAAMRAEFGRLWDGPDIVETIGAKWEDAPEIEADLVFGANAFYRIGDIAAALRKMDRIAPRRVALVQTIGRPHAEPLALTVDGRTHERARADALCDVLDELGIAHRRRDYRIARPDGPGMVALIDWSPPRPAGSPKGF